MISQNIQFKCFNPVAEVARHIREKGGERAVRVIAGQAEDFNKWFSRET